MTLCVKTGVAGLSIEDSTGDKASPLYPFDLALARIKAARAAIDKTGEDVMLTARTEGFIRGRPDMDETLRRLKAFAEAGADCLYAPGIKTRAEIETVVNAVAPKPVNILIGWPSDLTVKDIAALGARRISVGGSLARAAWGGFVRAARQLADGGCFGGFADAAPAADLNAIFPRRPRQAAGSVTEPSTFRPAAATGPGRLGGPIWPRREARSGAAFRLPLGRSRNLAGNVGLHAVWSLRRRTRFSNLAQRTRNAR